MDTIIPDTFAAEDKKVTQMSPCSAGGMSGMDMPPMMPHELMEFLGVTEPLRRIGFAITPINDSTSNRYVGMVALGAAAGAVASLALAKIFISGRKVTQPSLLA